MARTELSRVGEIVRRHDPDRFFTALFAPTAHRDTLFTLYAFNHELARASEVTREPFAALIRLQWWREVLEGARRRHEVAGPLGEALDEGRLATSDLMRLVDSREAEVEAMPDLEAFTEYVRGTAGTVMVAAARALGMADPEILCDAGAAYGIAGVLRMATRREGQGRTLLPADGTSVPELTSLASAWAQVTAPVPRSALAAALPVVLARNQLRSHGPSRGRLAVLAAVIRGYT